MICNKCNRNLPDDSEFCQYCGGKIEKEVIATDTTESIAYDIPVEVNYKATKSNTTKKTKLNNKLLFFTNISSMILTVVSMLSIIIALNIQDYRRNSYEDWNTSVVYFVLLFILGTFLGFAINSLIKKKFKLLSIFSIITFVVAIFLTSEGSILSNEYNTGGTYLYYYNWDLVEFFNAIWVYGVFCVMLICLIPVIVATIKKVITSWHQSISYRDKCYTRIAKIHGYLEKGIITQEEFERTKKDILKNID